MQSQDEEMDRTKTKFTDDVLSIKDEVFNLREMASQLEIMQQSADFLMHGAFVTNKNLDEPAFERTSEHARKTTRPDSRNQPLNASKTGSI